MAYIVLLEIGGDPHKTTINGDNYVYGADFVDIYKNKGLIATFMTKYVVGVIEEEETPQEEKGWKLP